MAKKRYYESRDFYAGRQSAREMEDMDRGMISEDRNAIANLPQNVVMKMYPRVDYDNYNLNDDIRGIDVQMRDDNRKEKRKSGMSYPEKY